MLNEDYRTAGCSGRRAKRVDSPDDNVGLMRTRLWIKKTLLNIDDKKCGLHSTSGRVVGTCGLTFELTRPRRQDGLPVQTMMSQGGCAGKAACRSGSG